MVKPTSDLGEDVTEETAPQCAACGTPIVQEPTHRVVTWVESAEIKTAHFCDDSCRQSWESE
jgi:hypothetical protein